MNTDESSSSDGIVDSQKGVSNTTIAVLVILALVITVIGTWAVLSGMNSASSAQIANSGTNVGKVSFTVTASENTQREDTGMVVLDVK
ncbi:MAG: hypothetical protein ACP5NW_00250 [Candidatus Woesearchaeota archaeon]